MQLMLLLYSFGNQIRNAGPSSFRFNPSLEYKLQSLLFPRSSVNVYVHVYVCGCPSPCLSGGGRLCVSADRYGRNWYLTGVTSFGPSTCGSREAVYTRVRGYVDWIRNNIR